MYFAFQGFNFEDPKVLIDICSDDAASSIACIQVVIWSGFNVYI